MPWDGAFPIGRGRGGRGPRAGLPGACPLAASRAPRWAPALGRGARRAGRGRGRGAGRLEGRRCHFINSGAKCLGSHPGLPFSPLQVAQKDSVLEPPRSPR